MTEYRFKYYNSKGGLYFFLAILGIPFLVVFSSAVLRDHISWIFWISIPLGVGLIAYFFRKFFQVSRGYDSITVDRKGFTSKVYGRVLFSDIHSIPPYGAMQAGPPAMRIKLHNGKKLVWQFDAKSPKGKEDALVFAAFRDLLFKHLKRQRQFISPEVSEEIAQDVNVAVDTDSPTKPKPVTASSEQVDVIEQMERHRKRDVNYKYLTLPIGLAVSIFLFVRTCGEDSIGEYKDRKLDGVRNVIQNAEVAYQDNVREALRVAKAYSKNFGPVYLFTNDPQGVAEFIPAIHKNPISRK